MNIAFQLSAFINAIIYAILGVVILVLSLSLIHI